jgi:hypothetical protein
MGSGTSFNPRLKFRRVILLFGFDSSKRLGHEFASEFSGVWRTGD